jgi:hypothetical protein
MALLLFVILLQLLIIAMASVFLFFGYIHILSDRAGVPFVRTPQYAFPLIARALDIQAGDMVYELGSGDGRFLRWAAVHYPSAQFIGIERNPILVRYAQYRAEHAQLTNIAFRKQDLFTADYAKPNKIYAYLLPSFMDRLLPTLERDFHGRLASRAFQFKNKTADAEVELSARRGAHGQHRLYIYNFKSF